VRATTWTLELDDLARRVALLEAALAGDPMAPDPGPWEPPAAPGAPPTSEEQERFRELMARIEACRTGVEQAARDLDSHVAQGRQRRAAARRYTRP
jgi:hypothetical protein